MDKDFSFWGNIASIISFFITIFISIGLFFVRRKFLLYGVEESHVNELVEVLKKLSPKEPESVVASKIRLNLRETLLVVQPHYTGTKLSTWLNKKIIIDISDLIKKLDTDGNCTAGAIRLQLKRIVLKMEKNPRLEYAIK